MSVQQRAAIPTRTRWSSYKFCVRAASCEQVASLRKSRCQGFSFFSPPISGLKRKKCFLGARANQQNKDELRSNSCLASSSYLYIDERRFRIERLVWNDSGMEKLAFKLQIRCWRLERPFSGGYGSIRTAKQGQESAAQYRDKLIAAGKKLAGEVASQKLTPSFAGLLATPSEGAAGWHFALLGNDITRGDS